MEPSPTYRRHVSMQRTAIKVSSESETVDSIMTFFSDALHSVMCWRGNKALCRKVRHVKDNEQADTRKVDFSLDLPSANSDILRQLMIRSLRVYLTFVVVVIRLFAVCGFLLTCGKGLVEGHGCLDKKQRYFSCRIMSSSRQYSVRFRPPSSDVIWRQLDKVYRLY